MIENWLVPTLAIGSWTPNTKKKIVQFTLIIRNFFVFWEFQLLHHLYHLIINWVAFIDI